MVIIPVKDINGFTLYRRKRLGEKIPLYVAYPTTGSYPDADIAPMQGEYKSIRDAERDLDPGPAEFKVTAHIKVARVWIDDGFCRKTLEERLREFIEEEMLDFSVEGEVTVRLKIK